MPNAFISHSSPDDRYVQEFCQLVKSFGYDEVFNDSHTIEPDEEFWPRIEKGIKACDAFVVILSHASVASYWVDREVQFARDEKKKIIPIRIDDCKLPKCFDGHRIIELRQGRGEKVKIAPSRILRHSPKILFGRDDELKALDDAWANPNLNVYTLVAWGGAGKTSLVAHWVQERLAAKGWPGVERYFDWSFYSQGTGESRQTSSDLFIQKALEFFGDPDPIKGSPWERGERLADLTRKHKTLLVLDGIEPLQYPPTDKAGMAGRLKDQALEALLQSLAADNPGLCVVTTREHLTNIEAAAATEEKKLDKLLKTAAMSLLRHLQVVGSDEEMHAAWEDAGGHALTLQLLGRFIADAYTDRDIRHYKEVKFEHTEEDRKGRSAFKVMVAYENWLAAGNPERQRELAILRLTGLFDRPASRVSLEALRAEPVIPGITDSVANVKSHQWNNALRRLAEIDLLTVTWESVDAHPLIREYFCKQLHDREPTGFTAAHSRMFDHLCEITPYRPDTLEGLGPLYQAVSHGCFAGRQQEACGLVLLDRIFRGGGGDGYYSSNILGAIGVDLTAIATFFVQPWDQLSPNLSDFFRAWLLNEAGLRLRALGRLSEAVEPQRVSMKMWVRVRDWSEAAITANNLCEMELLRGQLDVAARLGRQSVEYADTSGDEFWSIGSRTTWADTLYHSGRHVEADTVYRDAERRRQSHFPELVGFQSLPGFRFCEWLFGPVDSASWEILCHRRPIAECKIDDHPSLTTIAIIESQAKRNLEWATKSNRLLDIALQHLTLAKASIGRAILTESNPTRSLDVRHVTEAVQGFRKAVAVHHLPKALLTAALYHFVRGEHVLAKKYLAETQQIAERGPMPLYLADVHLHRARMFKDKGELAKAKELIVKHGYGRRNEELADAELAAAKGW